MKTYTFPAQLLRDEDCADTDAGHERGAWTTRQQLVGIYTVKHDLVRGLIPRRGAKVLELGVRAGYSAEVFLAAGARSYVGVDLEDGWWGEVGLVEPAMQALAERYPMREIAYMLADSHAPSTIAEIGKLAPFDLIHFDGDQFYDGATQDLRDYMPMLKPTGVAIIDGPPTFGGFDRAGRDWARANGYYVTVAPSPFAIGDEDTNGYAAARRYPGDLVLRRPVEPEQVIVPGPQLGVAA